MATNNSTNTSNPVTVGQGGTGLATATTAYAVVCAGTVATGNLQVLNSLGTSAQVLTSNGAGALPTWQAAAGGGGGNTTTAVAQTAHGLTVGQLVKSTGTNTYAVAQADTAADCEIVGIVSVVTDANNFTLLTAGVITTLSGLTAGTVYFSDPSVAGGYTSTAPTTAGQIRKPVLVAINTTSANFVNYLGEIIPSTGTSTAVGNNMIMNGGLQIFQRYGNPFGSGGGPAAIAASTTAYTFDRFQLLTNANQAATVTQVKIVPWQFQGRIQRNSGQTGVGVMQFGTSLTGDMIVGCQGNPVTLQFLLSTGANWSPTSGNLTVTVAYGTNTTSISNISSAFTGVTSVISQTIAAGTSLAQTLYSFTSSTVPTTATQLSVVFSWTPSGTASTNDWFQVGNIQLEAGSTANLFQRIPFAQEYENCQHFYNKNFDGTTIPAQGAQNTGAYFQSTCAGSQICNIGIPFSRNLFKSGVITLYNPVSANAQVYDNKIAADCSSTTANTAQGNNGFKLVFTTDSGATTNSYYSVGYQVDSDVT
jgi:hypothetical protein